MAIVTTQICSSSSPGSSVDSLFCLLDRRTLLTSPLLHPVKWRDIVMEPFKNIYFTPHSLHSLSASLSCLAQIWLVLSNYIKIKLITGLQPWVVLLLEALRRLGRTCFIVIAGCHASEHWPRTRCHQCWCFSRKQTFFLICPPHLSYLFFAICCWRLA